MFGRLEKLHNPKYNPFNSDTLVKIVGECYELRKCEEPYIGAEDHLILRDTNRELVLELQESIKRRDKEQLIKRYKRLGYTIIENAEEDKSVPRWEHTHIIKPTRFISFKELNKWVQTQLNPSTS